MHYNAQRALQLLRLSTGQPGAEFREGQEAAIRHIVEGRGRLLVVQKTGWGKSFVYFIATKLLREAGAGPALLISPLLALMRNQVAPAERMGVRAYRITSDNQEDWPVAEERLRRDEVDILLISPERLGNEHFRTDVLADVSDRIALLVIDEAHCISDWGHDFRPRYRLIERIARTLPANLRLLATTATANNRVMEDLRAVLGPDLFEAGHMEFLIRALDGEPGAVQPPDLAALPTEVAPDILHEAVVFLRRTSLPIKPRQKWPVGGLPRYRLSGRIAKEHRAEDGKSLCIWRDAGWGELVRRGKYQDGRFADELVSASVELMARWAPQPAPEWVTCIPSRRRPDLVPDFVERLAMRMGLPFHRALEKVEERAEQKSMENSTQQARNVDGSLAVSLRPLPGPVLLVDDLVDSRWTLTVAAWLLRSSGSGVVVPLSLAYAGYD